MLVHKDVIRQPLYMVTPIFNPGRFQMRWAHYRDFAKRMVDAGVKLITIEAAFEDRDHAIQEHAPDGNGHRYIKLRVSRDSEIWIKENLQNIAVSQLPHDWQYLAFADADLSWARPDIVDATLHALQHWDVAQMFSHIVSAGPHHQPLSVAPSFAYQHVNGRTAPQPRDYGGGKPPSGKNLPWGVPGGAWAWRRSAFEAVGRLIEHPILGAADHYMAMALIGDADGALDKRFTQAYRDPIINWQKRAESRIKRNIGYVEGTVWHYWHGSYTSRRYNTRAKILIRNAFDPNTDLKHDWQGVMSLTGNKPRLRDDVRSYFHQRNEDDIHVRDDEHQVVPPKPNVDWSSP